MRWIAKGLQLNIEGGKHGRKSGLLCTVGHSECVNGPCMSVRWVRPNARLVVYNHSEEDTRYR